MEISFVSTQEITNFRIAMKVFLLLLINGILHNVLDPGHVSDIVNVSAISEIAL